MSSPTPRKSDQNQETLQAIIARRGESRPTLTSDREILKQADLHCAKRSQRTWSILSWLFAPAGVVGNTFASVAVTAIVFLVLAQVVVPPTLELDSGKPGAALATTPTALQSQSVAAQAVSTMVRPEVELYSPDQVLLEISLPDVTDLIRSMAFVAEDERAEATIELISALADIESSIGVGELGAARQRYSELRERCYACNLPATLEALALLDLNNAERG